MICAIGTPGQPVRMIVKTRRVENALLQIGDGEVLIETDREAPATIAPDGLTLIYGDE